MFSTIMWAGVFWSLAWTGIMFIVWADSPIEELRLMNSFRSIVILTTWLAGLIAINFTMMSV